VARTQLAALRLTQFPGNIKVKTLLSAWLGLSRASMLSNIRGGFANRSRAASRGLSIPRKTVAVRMPGLLYFVKKI
jgi:hypothetical protein